jgi:hypothetical protein
LDIARWPWGSGRAMSALHTDESASSLWPTPTVQYRAGSAGYSTESGRHSGTTLADAVRMWPTPDASGAGSNKGGAAGRVGQERPALATAVKLCPTTRAHDGRGGCGRSKMAQEQKTGMDLKEAVRGSLNPAWVETLMGFPPGWTDGPPVREKRSTHGSRREPRRAS